MNNKRIRGLVALFFLLTVIIGLPHFAQAEEVILLDNDSIVVKVKGFEEDPIWGFTMKVYLENKTDKELMFSINDGAINGYMNDPFWAKAIMAGSKVNDSISWNLDEEVTQVFFTLRIFDNNDWMADAILEEQFTIYPLGEEKATITEREPGPKDKVLFDNDQATMIITDMHKDDIWGYVADVYLINKTDKKLMFSVDGATVNNSMCDPFWANEVIGSMRSYSQMTWMSSTLEENDITTVEEIKLNVKVSDSDDFMEEPLVDEQFTVIP